MQCARDEVFWLSDLFDIQGTKYIYERQLSLSMKLDEGRYLFSNCHLNIFHTISLLPATRLLQPPIYSTEYLGPVILPILSTVSSAASYHT